MATPPASPDSAGMPRIFYARAGLPAAGHAAREPLLAGARRAGFTAVLAPVPWLRPPGALSLAPVDADRAFTAAGGTEPLEARLARDARSVADHGMTLLLRLELQRVARDAVDGTAPAAWYRDPVDDPARDPRLPLSTASGNARGPAGGLHRGLGRAPATLDARGRGRLCGAGAAPPRGPRLAGAVRALAPGQRRAALPGLDGAPEALAALRGAGFDGVFSSLPWWDYRAPWLAEEWERLRAIAPVIAPACALEDAPWMARRAAAISGAPGPPPSAAPAGLPTGLARPMAPRASMPGCTRPALPAHRESRWAATAAPPWCCARRPPTAPSCSRSTPTTTPARAWTGTWPPACCRPAT
ncbi:hypothetical protein WJ972_13640 [Achromobacter insuavis]